MENLSNKKVLSECNQYLGHGVCFNSAKKEDCHSSNHSSNFAKENIPINTFTFSMMSSSLQSPLHVDKSSFLPDSNSLTPNKDKGETKTSSVDFSVLTAADFRITPESFTKHQGRARSVLTKLRRQSTIGVRGSPENNALIRYISHRKRMGIADSPSQASPFQRNALLKDKIAAFQSSFKTLEEAAEEIIHTPYTFKKADTRSHEDQLDQVGPSEYKAVEETLNRKSTNGEKSSANIQEIPISYPNTLESRCLLLEASPAAGISNTACGIRPQNTNEELNSSTASQQSCKKVRFAEKQSLEIFDETKPSTTPLQKGHFLSTYHDSSNLRSVLKKTPVKILAEDTKGHLAYTNTRKGSEEPSVFQSCGSLQTERSTRSIVKMEAHNKEEDVKVFDIFQPVDSPMHSGEASFSLSGTKNDTAPIKKPLSQPNFDDDGAFQETSEVVSTVESIVNSDDTEDKETKVSSPDLHSTCIRVTRSSAKKVHKEETSISLTRETRTRRTRTTNRVPNPRKIQNENSVAKSASKKTPAPRRKAFGKRKRRKKTQKVFHGHYETVSKKPLLSPILEMTEDTSLISSYQSTSESSGPIFDHSCSSLVHETPEETNNILRSTEEYGSCLHSTSGAAKEDALPNTVSCLFLQLQDGVPNDIPITFPLESPGNDSPKDLKNTLNGQVLKNDCENEKELGLHNLQKMAEKISKEALLTAESAVVQPSGGGICVNSERFSRRSRKTTRYLPSVDDFPSETPRNNPCVPRGSMEELPCTPQTINDSGFLNDVLIAIEESFRSVTSSTQRVRRSMRLLKNEESEGLAWISVSANDSVNQALVGSEHKSRRKSCAFCHPKSEMLHQQQENLVQSLLPMMEDQKSVGVHCRPRKKRKNICSQRQGED
ncbi:cell division cycle-associated protein 2 [Heteronotia binoei]|uniref:cell division cycle-associated protein 2 n=1 Tax=Heteronotia binoei TaxID=13085 RepID=UPI00292D567B|nr:cell division cycle-associated protein 2 [Heteronotia binoei]XP_060107015.1 cell division cycle-associated protein 2 [Heteronotia binoei]